jgi:hypothetical protein
VKPSPTVRPRWFILYNGLEPFQHRKWHCRSDVERGVVKWLHMAGGYGRLRYQPWYWQPVPVDRGIGVDVEKPPASAKVN